MTVRDYGVGLRPGEEKAGLQSVLAFGSVPRASLRWHRDWVWPSRIEDARLHQGRLEAWGEPGKGACFRLTLPLVRGHKVTASPLPLKPIGGDRPRNPARDREPAGERT